MKAKRLTQRQYSRRTARFQKTLTRILRFLEQKGVEELAEYFEEKRIRGKIGSSSRCPVARYVRKRVQVYYRVKSVAVGQEDADIIVRAKDGVVLCGHVVFKDLPNNKGTISDFIERFDDEEFPKLRMRGY